MFPFASLRSLAGHSARRLQQVWGRDRKKQAVARHAPTLVVKDMGRGLQLAEIGLTLCLHPSRATFNGDCQLLAEKWRY